MTKKDAKQANSAAIPSPAAIPKQVKVQAFSLRGERNLGLTGLPDSATERVWRNCQYPERVTFDMFFRMYSRNNVAARVIETFPDYSWSVMPFVTDEGGEKSQFSKSVATLLSTQYKMQDGVKQSLLASMKQLDVLGGIGGESLLVFGFTDGRRLNEPVSGNKGTEIGWIKLLHNGQFEVEKRDEEETSATFGDIILYKTKDFASTGDLNFNNQIANNRSIHASRCVHFKESNGLSYGTSRIQKCYNQLLDITKLSGASAEVYWLGAFSGLSIETDPQAMLSDESYATMKEETTKYFDGLARSLIFEGATSKLLYPAIVSPKDHFDLQITMISIATGIPRRFLTGAEAAKLASQQDTLNWMERVTNRREMFVGPKVVSPVVQRCIDAGVIRKPVGNTFSVAWPRIQSLALNERADASRNMTAAWMSYFSSGMAEIVPFRVYLLYTCGFSENEAEDIERKTDWTKWKVVQKTNSSGGTTGTPEKSNTEKTDKAAAELEGRIVEIEERLDDMPTPSSIAYQDRPEQQMLAQARLRKRRGE